jgi:hypothetical protein
MMYIHGHGSFVGPPVQDLKTVKTEVSRHTQVHFRRANRFVLISLAGACRCAQGHRLEKDTAVYLTTENGNLGDTETVLHQIYHKHEFPMPYNFINTMSNTASFYVAQSLALLGRNITFSSKQLPFERGLELLRCDMLAGAVTAALIGGADEACFSKPQFEAKFHRPYEAYTMVEGSSWLLIKTESAGALGEIRALASFDDIDQTVAWVQRQELPGPVSLAFGILPDEQEMHAALEALPRVAAFDYIAERGYFDSAAARGVTDFLEGAASGCLVHLNKDFRGQFVVLVVEKY